jgi:hypothetical protein
MKARGYDDFLTKNMTKYDLLNKSEFPFKNTLHSNNQKKIKLFITTSQHRWDVVIKDSLFFQNFRKHFLKIFSIFFQSFFNLFFQSFFNLFSKKNSNVCYIMRCVMRRVMPALCMPFYVVHKGCPGDARGMPGGCPGFFLNPHFKKSCSRSVFTVTFFSWDVVDVGFPTCYIM